LTLTCSTPALCQGALDAADATGAGHAADLQFEGAVGTL
jgi:hypothetical protein